MKIHEYQGKELLKQFGMTVPTGIPCFSVDEAVKAAEELGRTLGTKVWVVKAQIHAGGRGKGGGVKVAKSLDEVRQYASQILGMQLITHQTSAAGQKVNRLLIEEGADIKKEYYLAVLTDRATQKVAIMASSEGGMDIEEVAHATPEKILKEFIDPLVGVTDQQALLLAQGIGVPAASQADAVQQIKATHQRAFAGAAATDDAEDLALTYRQVNITNRINRTAGAVEALGNCFDFYHFRMKKGS